MSEKNFSEEIEKLAYEIYEKNGRVGGRDLDHWIEAEQMVRACGSCKEAGSKNGSGSTRRPAPKKSSGRAK